MTEVGRLSVALGRWFNWGYPHIVFTPRLYIGAIYHVSNTLYQYVGESHKEVKMTDADLYFACVEYKAVSHSSDNLHQGGL